MARYALVVGIAEYDTDLLPALTGVTTDIEAVAQILEHHGNFQEVKRLSGRLTCRKLKQALREFLLEQAAKSEALIYLSSHGITVSDFLGVQNGYLATSDCVIKTEGQLVKQKKGFPLHSFNELIHQSDLKSLVVILDCCHSQHFWKRSLIQQTLTAFNSHKNYSLITNSRAFEIAFVDEQRSVFTDALIKGLSPGNAESTGQIGSDRLFDFLAQELKNSGQEPICIGLGSSILLVQYPPQNQSLEVNFFLGTLIQERYRIIEVLSSQEFKIDFSLFYHLEIGEEIRTVFLAKDETLPGEPRCILTQLNLTSSVSNALQEAIEQFEWEARILGKIGNHPNLPRLLDYFESNGAFYIAQEYIDGSTLQQEIQQSGSFSEDKIIDFLNEFLPILEYIHSEQVIHRNINPTTIVRRNQDRRLCLIDFGAALGYSSQQIVRAIGTPGFAPPEQMAERPVYASDIYALGVTCIYLLTNKTPKELDYNPSTGEILWRNLVEVSDRFADVLKKMLEASVRHRYQSATEVLEAIRPLTSSYPTIKLVSYSSVEYSSLEELADDSGAEFVAHSLLITISSNPVLIGGELEVAIQLSLADNNDTAYLLEIPRAEVVGGELNIFLTAPGFQFNGDDAINLSLDTGTDGEISSQQVIQTARFHLTALRPGSTTLKAELYCGETFNKSLETKVQVAGFDEAELRPIIAARSRPVPQPDLILQVRTAWNNDTSAFTFRYHIDTFQQRLLFADDSDYCSKSLPAGWVERAHLLLKTTLEDAASSLPEDFRSRLASLGQYLFERLLPAELQSIFRSIAGFNRPFTWLILADQDAWFPWELLHDGQTFLGDRFIIGRWLWELDKARPYEFPVGAVNVAHYASVEQPEVWTALLEPPGAPPPMPLAGGVLADLSSTESMRGLHLIRFGQSSDAANRRDSPVLVNGGSGNLDIEREVQPAKLSLRRNRPLVTLGYVSAGQPELTALEHTWASTFVRAGCSAFVGSLWAVQPDVEAAFVGGFYHNLWAGQSLGMAFQAARRLARAVAPESLDWLAYVLFGDPMARPYRPVKGQGYAVVEPIGQEIDDPVPPGATVRFRVSLRRTPPVWYENRLMEVAEDLTFEDLLVFIVTSGLQVIPADSVEMRRTPTGDYLGWFSLSVPREMESQSVLVQVFFEDGMEPVHNLRFQVLVGNGDGEGR